MTEEGRVLELVVYKLNEGVSREQFLRTNEAVSTWISRQAGFVSRELLYDGEGDRWVDLIWWETIEQAHDAMERSTTSESCTPMFAQVNDDSMLLVHGVPAIAPVAPATPAAV